MSHTINEHTSLLNNGITNGNHLQKDEFTWRDWPAHTLYITWHTLKSNPVNVLLVFVPLGIVGGAMNWDPTAIFILNFLAIIPLASLLSFATEELAAKLGQTLGGLLNATFGNAVELIVSIVALQKNEIRIVQSSMIGSMLSNMLLVLGCCFLSNGLNPNNGSNHEAEFNMTAAQTMAGLLAVASSALIIPAALFAIMSDAGVIKVPGGMSEDTNITVLSHGTAIILILLYILYLFFQLKTHAKMFQEEEGTGGDAEEGGESGEEEEHLLSPISAAVVLVVITVLVSVCAEYLVGSIESVVETTGISKTFVGLILIPIVGNAAEHVTAIVVSYKNKMDLAIGVAVGSSLQIALGVTPALVLLGWAMGRDMTLHFETFETIVFFLSVWVVNYLIQDGKGNYLEGAMLIGVYIIIAIAFYVYPDEAGRQAIIHLGGKIASSS